MLSRRAMLAGAGAACARAACAFAGGREGVLTAADVHVDGYPTVEAVRFMSRIIERETQGRLRVRVYHSGQLGREADSVNLTRFGALDIARVNLSVLNNAFPTTRVLSLPYVFDSTSHMRRAVDGKVGQAILQSFQARGLIGLAFYDSGARCIYNTQRPVVEPGDLHGLKIRVPPSDIFLRVLRTFGANPTPLSFGEVYSALQTRLIDGAENNWRSFHSSRHFEVARYWGQTAHSYSPEALLISQRRFERLSPREREIVQEAAIESVPYMRQLWDRSEAESRSAVIAAGVQVSEVDRAGFRHAAAPMLEAYLEDRQLGQLYRDIRELG